MEGKLTEKRFSKKSFLLNAARPKKVIAADLASPIENLSTKSGMETTHSEEEPQSAFDQMIPIPLSQASTQLDEGIDFKDIFKSNVYTTEENDEEASTPDKIMIKNKKKSVFDDITANSGLYTLEESEEENEEKHEIHEKVKKVKGNEQAKDEESDENDYLEVDLPVKRKKSYKKIAAVPLKTLNKLVEVKKDAFLETGETPDAFLDEEIQIAPREKPKNFSFLEKIKQNQVPKSSYIFAKGLFSDASAHESLEIKAPQTLGGFTVRKQTINPREILRESLRSVINQRKTVHLNPEAIFDKAATDLLGKAKKKQEESEDSDYVPEDNEEKEAMEMEKIIKLEEGSEASEEDRQSISESDTASEAGHENLENLITNPSGEGENNAEDDSQSKAMDIDQEIKVTEADESMEIDKEPGDKLSDTEESEAESSNLSDEDQNKPVSSLANGEDLPALQKVFPKSIKMSKFIEKEAEMGSDHEEHDDLIKQCKDSESEISEENDKDLEEIIDRQLVEDNEDIRYDKHLDQLIKDDEDQLRKVVNAEFRKQRKDIDFIDGPSTIISKKQQLLDEKKSILARRETSVFSKNPEENGSKGEMDDEEFSRYKVLKSSQELRYIRNQFSSKTVIDEQSLSYLSLITKPENTVSSKSLLNDSDKSNSMRVFKTSMDLSSNRGFVFSKDKPESQAFEKTKNKKTKLYKLLGRDI